MPEFLYPIGADSERIEQVLDARSGPVVGAFDARTVEMLERLSRALFAVARDEPAVAPLAFFLRKANIVGLIERARERVPGNALAVPQGTVFHVPPTNVDTLFLYTLAISLLAGNANVVRISPNAGPATERVLQVLLDEISKDEVLASRLTVLRFGREQRTLDACSSRADVRMIWGGDGAIHSIRHSPLAPAAKELTFPDRVSLAAIDAVAWSGASEEQRDLIAQGLYNDVYWFDQMACSSPAQLVVVGPPKLASSTTADLAGRLDAVAERRYDTVDGQAINKMVALVSGMGRGLGSFEWVSNDLVVVEADDLAAAVQFRPGGGFLSSQRVDKLSQIAPQLTRRVQTLSVYGFSNAQLREFAELANGRGVDRIVPIGKALDFDSVWDGKDLLFESLRFVTVDAGQY